jgi:hypothetical protein
VEVDGIARHLSLQKRMDRLCLSLSFARAHSSFQQRFISATTKGTTNQHCHGLNFTDTVLGSQSGFFFVVVVVFNAEPTLKN